MNKEELLNLLHEKGLDDAAIKALLEEIVHDMNPEEVKEEETAKEENEEAEKKEAEKLLGVSLE